MNRRGLLLLAVLAVVPVHAADYYVDADDPTAADTNPGTIAKPFVTVQKAADLVQPGDTVRLKAGVYRQQFVLKTSGTEKAPITFEAAPGDEGKVLFRGTEIVPQVDQQPGPHGTVLSLSYDRKFWILGEEGKRELRDYVDQCFVDDELLQIVPEREMLRPGRYWVDRTAQPNQLLLMLPTGKRWPDCHLEVSRLQRAISFVEQPGDLATRPRHHDVVIRNLSFFGFATNPRCPVIDLRACRQVRVEGCKIRWSNSLGIQLTSCSYVTLAGNDVQHCGHLGIGGGQMDHITLEDNITSHNNYKLYSVWWECGGVKLCGITDSTIRRHLSIGNLGEGMWFDWDCSRNTVEGCLSAYNVVTGFLNEVAPGNTFRNNIFAFNRVVQGAGISISGSSDVVVENNIFYGNEGNAVDIGGAPGKRAYGDDFVKCNNNRLAHNIMAANFANVGSVGAIPRYAENNRSDQNLLWAWKSEQPFLLDGKLLSLEEWRGTTGNDRNSVVADPGFADPEAFNFTLKPGSPALRIGFNPKALRLDWSKLAHKPDFGALGGGQKLTGTPFLVDLQPYFNRALRDEVAADGKGGWTDQGPNDMRNLPTGERSFEGIPFRVGKGPKAAVALASKNCKLAAPLRVMIPVGHKAGELYFLHTSAWTTQGEIMRYVIKVGGEESVLSIRAGTEITDWWSPVLWQEAEMLESHGTFVAWQGANGSVGRVTVFGTRWINPRPDQPIESVTFEAQANQEAVPLLLAITGVEGPTEGAGALQEAGRAAGLPSPEKLRFYVSFDGAASALTPTGELEADEAKTNSVNLGEFLPGVRGRALHIGQRLTYDNLTQYLDPKRGTLSVWVRPDDWFTEAKMKEYAGAGYRRRKCLMTAGPVRTHVTVPRDPSTELWAVEMDALGGPEDRKTRLGLICNNVNRPSADTTTWAAGTWHHVAMTWQGIPKGKVALYLDGVKVAEQTVGTALLPPDPILFLGNARNGGYLLDGALDEFALWNAPLDGTDIAAYYDRTRPR